MEPEDCDWMHTGMNNPIPRKIVKVRERYLTIVSKDIIVRDVAEGAVLRFSSYDIPGHPKDCAYAIKALEFCILSSDKSVFCSEALCRNKDIISPNGWVTLPFLASQWETMYMPPGTELSLTLFKSGEPAPVVASFAVIRVTECP